MCKLFEEVVRELEAYDIESVADAAEVSDQCLYNWLNGRVKNPYVRNVVRVAEVLGIQVKVS